MTPFDPAEANLLRRAWNALWPVVKILADLAPRRPEEVLRQIDVMLLAPDQTNGVRRIGVG